MVGALPFPSTLTSTVARFCVVRCHPSTLSGDAGALEALLASEPARSAKSQPEVASASKALQVAKARSDEEAEAAR